MRYVTFVHISNFFYALNIQFLSMLIYILVLIYNIYLYAYVYKISSINKRYVFDSIAAKSKEFAIKFRRISKFCILLFISSNYFDKQNSLSTLQQNILE